MKKLPLLPAIILLLSTTLFAQAPWTQLLNPEFRGDVEAFDVGYDDQNNLYVTGRFNDTMAIGNTVLVAQGFENIFLFSMDPQGNLRWAVTESGVYAPPSHFMEVEGNGNVWLAGDCIGCSFDSTVINASGPSVTFVAKYNSSGDLQWARGNSGGTYSLTNGRGIAVDEDGNGYFGGTFLNDITFGSTSLSSSSYTIFVTKLDSNGNYLWAKQAVQSVNSFTQTLLDLVLNENNELLITGSYLGELKFPGLSSSLPNNPTGNNDDVFLAKLNSNGTFQWAEKAGGMGLDNKDYGTDIAIGENGDIFLVGTFGDDISFGSTTLNSTDPNQRDYFLAKYNDSGNFQWAKHWGPIGPTFGAPSLKAVHVLHDAQRGIMVAGSMGNTNPSSQNAPMFLTLHDLNGIFQWSKAAYTYYPNWPYGFKMRVDDFAFDPVSTHPVILSSYHGGVALDQDTLELCPVEIDTTTFPGDTLYQPRTHWVLAEMGVPIMGIEESISHSPLCWPNPTTGLLHINLETGYDYRVMDLYGKELAKGHSNPGQVTLDLSAYPKGILLLEVAHGPDHFIRKIWVQ